MSRIQNAILQAGSAFGSGVNAPMVDLQHGGQMGFAPDYTEYVNNQAYVKKNLICVLVEAPKGFQYLPNPDVWVGTLRSLVEMHAMSIEGLNAGLEVDVAENAVGGGGQMQEDFTDVKETRSQPVFRFTEKYGMPIARFMRGWITNLMMDPNTKVANIATLSGSKPTDMLADMYSATMLFIEPDPLHGKVVKSWLGTNMFPKGTGEITGRRDLTSASETTSYDINFTGIFQFGLGVDAFAQKILDGMSLVGANPYNRAAFIDNISADVAAMKKSYGQGISDLASAAVKV